MNLTRTLKLLSRLTLLGALSAALAPAAHAQFSGPAPGSSTEVNLPITLTTDPAVLYPKDREIIVRSGDVLAVHVLAAQDYAPTVRVSIDGTVNVPLIGSVPVQDMTLHDIEIELTKRFIAAGIFVDPQVTIQLTESPNQVITLTGETHSVVPVAGRRRLFDVLAIAGGLPPTASHIITIHRAGLDTPISIDLGTDPAKAPLADIPVFAGDTIVTSRVGNFYVLGAFKTQSMFPLGGNAPVTLLQALSVAGGPNFDGKKEDTRIIRTAGLKRYEVKVNMSRVLKGQDPDPVLQAEDIVYLPSSAIKAAIRSGGIATLLGFATFITFTTAR